MKLSVVLATYNEEKNIGECLESVSKIADEVIIIDGSSSDRTREIASSLGAKIIKTTNPPIFHINKQKALEKARGEWILQLDADERVTNDLKNEILEVIDMPYAKLDSYQEKVKRNKNFIKHKKQLEERDGKIGKEEGEYVAFFIPRLNFFLGKYLRYGGVYPDGVIRLVKNGKAFFPAKSVHEQIVVDGKVGWLTQDLIHIDSPTFDRYLKKNSMYIDLIRD